MPKAKSQSYTLSVGEVEHQIRVNDEDLDDYQEMYGDRMKPVAKKKAASNKARTPANKSADADQAATADAAETK